MLTRAFSCEYFETKEKKSVQTIDLLTWTDLQPTTYAGFQLINEHSIPRGDAVTANYTRRTGQSEV